MKIGTAVPSKEELSKANHHFIQHKSISENYNVGAFEKDALDTLEILFKKNNIVILVGGSGLYIDAITNGLDDFPMVDKKIRKSLNLQLQNDGLASLQKKLKELDLISFENIAIDNPHRVIRALEISLGTGQPYSSFLTQNKKDRPFKTIYVGLTAERAIIYDRINKRVDLMINQGLLDEVKALLPYRNLNALNTVGYKELFNYLDGEWSLEFAISEIKKNTRRFAKRQLTWFRKNENISWFDFETPFEEIISSLEAKIN